MEYLPGSSLQDLIEAEGVLSLERALPILAQVAGALDHAHTQGVVHRDVKPSNVMVEETDQGVQVTLTDFDLVKAMARSSVHTSQCTLLGSPKCMAPEQAGLEGAAEGAAVCGSGIVNWSRVHCEEQIRVYSGAVRLLTNS